MSAASKPTSARNAARSAAIRRSALGARTILSIAESWATKRAWSSSGAPRSGMARSRARVQNGARRRRPARERRAARPIGGEPARVGRLDARDLGEQLREGRQVMVALEDDREGAGPLDHPGAEV